VRRLTLGMLALLALAMPVRAATYYVDASIGGTTNGNTGYTDYVTPLYSFQPGDTVDFGSVDIFPYPFTEHNTQFLLTGSFAISFNGAVPEAFPTRSMRTDRGSSMRAIYLPAA
jgi:hypothetical protein